MKAANTLRTEAHPFTTNLFDYVITNPPYGTGTIQANTSVISTVRTEIAFLCRIREVLRVGGQACVIQPDGVLENPSLRSFRKELLETCDITAIVSLPKFAFAPYTKEKTYALFLTKRSDKATRIQSHPIWMYIIDNDGLANSDKRYPTKLRNNRNGWIHDEVSGWVSTDGEEMPGILEERWLKYEDQNIGGTEWMDESGVTKKLRKGGHISIEKINSDKYHILLPEYYLRSWHLENDALAIDYEEFQVKNVPCCDVFDIIAGNSGLTEEYMYSLLLSNDDKKYKLLTGSIDLENTISIPLCRHPNNADKFITVVSGEGVHISRNGKAGNITYLPNGDYTLNDHAYILIRKPSIDWQVSLEWLAKTQKAMFKEYSSKSENGTWNKTGFLKHAKFDIPSYEEQLKTANIFNGGG